MRFSFRSAVMGCASAVLTASLLGACNTTTIAQTAATSIPAGDTTTTAPLPTDTPTQLRQIVQLTAGLGDLIADGGAGPVLHRINALWTAAATAVGPNEPELRQQIDVQIAIIEGGVKYKRSADEDKASTNLGAIVATYLQRHPAG